MLLPRKWWLLFIVIALETVILTNFFLVICGQVEKLLNAHHLEEAILLAETIAAVEETKNPQKAEEVEMEQATITHPACTIHVACLKI